MKRDGKIATGCITVRIGGKPAARISDLTTHGGAVLSGCPTVSIGAAPFSAARLGDQFACAEVDVVAPHAGGVILGGFPTVWIGGQPAARQGDETVCNGAVPVPGGVVVPPDSRCDALWKRLDDEARALIEPGDDDDRQRNRIISGAYADLFLRNPQFQWAGLAAYASKQVGCVMDSIPRKIGAAAGAGYLLTVACMGLFSAVALGAGGYGASKRATSLLGHGNRELFLNIYPMHRFYEEHGWELMQECGAARMNGPALDGFEALHLAELTGDASYLQESVASLAAHEQISVLQKEVYDQRDLRAALEIGEATKYIPAEVVLSSECSDPTGDKTHAFADGDRDAMYDIVDRMDWIMNQIGEDYFSFVGSRRHRDDLHEIKRQGTAAGGQYE